MLLSSQACAAIFGYLFVRKIPQQASGEQSGSPGYQGAKLNPWNGEVSRLGLFCYAIPFCNDVYVHEIQ